MGEGVRTRVVVLCGTCGVHWDEGEAPAACDDDTHEHQRFDVHVHRDVVVLPDGTEVVAVSFDAGDPYTRERSPDFGLYLDPRWQPPWAHELLDWPDFGVPGDPAAFTTALDGVLERARRGDRVEVGCLGGHGRTGTAIAALAVRSGHPADDAVAWARAHYCDHAVETPEQEALVASLEAERTGRTWRTNRTDWPIAGARAHPSSTARLPGSTAPRPETA